MQNFIGKEVSFDPCLRTKIINDFNKDFCKGRREGPTSSAGFSNVETSKNLFMLLHAIKKVTMRLLYDTKQ